MQENTALMIGYRELVRFFSGSTCPEKICQHRDRYTGYTGTQNEQGYGKSVLQKKTAMVRFDQPGN